MKRRPPSGEVLRPTEFYRPFDTGEMSDDVAEREISANDAERAALAQRFGLQALDRLSATLTVRRVDDNMFHVSGRLAAAVVQQCVVTLEPLKVSLDEPVAVTFVKPKIAAPKGKAGAAEAEEGLEEEGPEIMAGDLIDLGEAVAQQLAVSLNPYPRAPGASLEAVLPPGLVKETAEEKRPSPFAVLETLRKTKPS
jgi:uncharacterized metal-binding protein YceD (DUF177 family)